MKVKVDHVLRIVSNRPHGPAKYAHRQRVMFLDSKGAPVNGWIDGHRDDYGIYCVQFSSTHRTVFLHENDLFAITEAVECAK